MRAALLTLSWLVAGAAQATSCPRLNTGAGQLSSTDPEINQGCMLSARIYCHLGEKRDDHLEPQEGIRLLRLSLEDPKTGSHVRANWSSGPAARLLQGAADYAWAHPSQPPWSLYYYSVFACGTARFASADGGDAAAVAAKYEASAQKCLTDFPATGSGHGNDGLRACLGKAMQETRPAPAK
jgi:hypothetical protein